MVDASVQTEKLTIDDFMRLYETEGPFEILDGERIAQASTVFGHSEILALLVELLQNFVRENLLGRVYPETAFILPDPENTKWVKGSRIPDILFIRTERLEAYKTETENYQNKPLMLVPDLVIEIVSPTDIHEDVDRKVDLYLEDGVQQVWVIKPKTQTISIYQGSERRNLTKDETLSGGDILPGFEIPVSNLFE